MLKQRDSNVDSDKNQMKKQLNVERKKVIDIEQKQKEYEMDIEKLKNKHVSDMLEKDDKIIKMTRETRDLEKKVKEQTQALL
jgi:hypothetical protein